VRNILRPPSEPAPVHAGAASYFEQNYTPFSSAAQRKAAYLAEKTQEKSSLKESKNFVTNINETRGSCRFVLKMEKDVI